MSKLPALGKDKAPENASASRFVKFADLSDNLATFDPIQKSISATEKKTRFEDLEETSKPVKLADLPPHERSKSNNVPESSEFASNNKKWRRPTLDASLFLSTRSATTEHATDPSRRHRSLSEADPHSESVNEYASDNSGFRQRKLATSSVSKSLNVTRPKHSGNRLFDEELNTRLQSAEGDVDKGDEANEYYSSNTVHSR